MIALFKFPTGYTLTCQPYVRSGSVLGAASGSPLSLTEDPASSGFYEMDLATLSAGDYFLKFIRNSQAFGGAVIRITSTDFQVASEWWELETNTLINVDGGITVTAPVASDGQLTSPIIIGDDYKSANGRAFTWTVAAVTGLAHSTATCFFGGEHKNGDTWRVEGDITDAGGGNWLLTFELARADTTGLTPGYYNWSVEIKGPSDGNECTQVYSGQRVELRSKQT